MVSLCGNCGYELCDCETDSALAFANAVWDEPVPSGMVAYSGVLSDIELEGPRREWAKKHKGVGNSDRLVNLPDWLATLLWKGKG